tara:strand:+ start:2705 stop:2887 length:183 start_codon:yes stop_codon:yes gene_type:complete
MGKYWVDEPLSMGGRSTIRKGVKAVSMNDIVKELNELAEWQEKAFEAHPNIDVDIENLET